MSLVSSGVIKLDKLNNQAMKLKSIFEKTVSIIKQYSPDAVSLEAPFFGKNVQSMLKLGRAQGVSMAAALHMNIPIFEYSPKKIKKSITGNGNSSKEQVAAMLQQLLGFEDLPKHLDATDGLSAAVCHYFQGNGTAEKKSYSSWKAFLNDNPSKKAGT